MDKNNSPFSRLLNLTPSLLPSKAAEHSTMTGPKAAASFLVSGASASTSPRGGSKAFLFTLETDNEKGEGV